VIYGSFECLRAPFESTKLLEAEDLIVPIENRILYDSNRLLKERLGAGSAVFFGRYEARFRSSSLKFFCRRIDPTFRLIGSRKI
jgi:hypothetical protein